MTTDSAAPPSSPPPLALFIPYEFDTRQHGRTIMRGVMYMILAIIAVIVLLLFTLDDPLKRLWIPVILAVFAVIKLIMALVIFHLAGGASGTVGKQHVTIEPDRFMGVPARMHRGTFMTEDYQGVEIRRISVQGSVGVLTLLPKDPSRAPRIVLGAMLYELAKQHAEFLCKELALTVLEPTS